MMGETRDISEYLDFHFYNYVSYEDNIGLGVTSIGRWLGVSRRLVELILYYIFIQKGTVTSIATVKRLANLEKETDKGISSINKLDSEISRSFKEEEDLTYYGSKPNLEDWSECL